MLKASRIQVLQAALRFWIAPVLLVFAVLACGTSVTQTPYYTCPTAIPPTDAPQPTYLPGTPIPFPTLLPLLPTPYIITPPQDFYLGDAVFVGHIGTPLRLRFRLQNVQSSPAQPLNGIPRNLYTWQLEILNLGSEVYETIPVALMFISRLDTANGQQNGSWTPSESAMQAAGFINENYDPLMPGITRIYRLAAYVPTGTVRQFTYLLDDDGNNQITWVSAANPYCSGDVAN